METTRNNDDEVLKKKPVDIVKFLTKTTSVTTLMEENNMLFFGVVKAWEYMKGNKRASYQDTIMFLEETMIAYGIRHPGYLSATKGDVTEKSMTFDLSLIPKRNAEIELNRTGESPPIPAEDSPERMIYEILSDGKARTPSEIADEMKNRGYESPRADPGAGVREMMKRCKRIFKIRSTKAMPTGGRVQVWTLDVFMK